jgi:hypothetical protein
VDWLKTKIKDAFDQLEKDCKTKKGWWMVLGPSFLDKELHNFLLSMSCISFNRGWTTKRERET